jgi:hypothetical protein
MHSVRTRPAAVAVLPLLLLSIAGCDIVGADFRAQETAEWRKTYTLAGNGRVEIRNINGAIDARPSEDGKVEVVATKVARGGSPELARQALDRIEIVEQVSGDTVRIETKVQRTGGFFNGGGGEVRYAVRLPRGASAQLSTTNGGVEVVGLDGRLTLESTNGGIRAREVAGLVEASTTNGGLDIDVTRIAEPGLTLENTNGGISLRLPADARATVSARVTNGGIDTGGLPLEVRASSRRELEGTLNGGGPAVTIRGTNGGIRLARR